MDRLISEQAIKKPLESNTVIDKVIEKQVEKNIKMREYWTSVFSNELIDRMSVIRAINDAYDESFDKESYRDKVTHKMMAIPSADKWIPVSESPKELGTYLIQTDGEPYMCQCRWTDVNPFWTDYKTKPHWNIFDLPQYSKVIAWMPLPKPYESQGKE